MRSLALLRGVNVGGHHKLAMKELVLWLEDAGLHSVLTYIQSGNVVADHDAGLDLGALVRRVIAEHAGFDVAVVVRDAPQMAEVVAANPYPDAGPASLHVAFRQDAPSPDLVAALDSTRWAPEEFTLVGREVYLHLPSGMGRSAMVPRLALVKDATLRNWNTVVALTELLRR